MKWRTEIKIPRIGTAGPEHRFLCLGSCFAQNIGQALIDHGIHCVINPLGIQFNPISIFKVMHEALNQRELTGEDLVATPYGWVYPNHHSRLARSTIEQALAAAQHANSELRNALLGCHWLILSLGTAEVYIERESGQIVANCHKLPAQQFQSRLLAVNEMLQTIESGIHQLKLQNPHLRLLCTVSPVRHIRLGLTRNSLSKARLLDCCHQMSQIPDVDYFPAYEIMVDDLRDYRFYSEDLIHPAPAAIRYIWQHFLDSVFDPATKEYFKAIQRLRQRLSHKPLDAQSPASQSFREQTTCLIEELSNRYPHLREIAWNSQTASKTCNPI